MTAGAIWIAIAVATAADEPAKTVDLRPLWKTGQASRYRINQTERTDVQVKGLGEPQSSTTDVEAIVAWEVTEGSESGGGKARMTVESMSMKITGADGQTRTVTAEAAEEPFANARQYIAALTGGQLTVDVKPDGSIGPITGHEAIKTKAGAAGEKLDESFFQDLARDLASLTGGQAAAAPAATWQHENDSDHSMGKIHQRYTDKLIGVEHTAGVPIAVIERKGELSLTPDLGNRPADAPQINVTTSEATFTGQLLFDLSRHELVGSAGRQVLTVEITVNVAGRQITRTVRETTEGTMLRISEK